jgi:site-specific DNA recombinase
MASLAQSPTKRAALYVRVSSSSQEEDGTSLATQERRCRDYASERGYAVDEAHVYREVYSGVELWERPQLTALRQAFRDQAFEVVVVFALDRLSRDPVHLGVVLSEADHARVSVQFVTEPLDDSPEGQLIRFVRGYAAKVEHLKIVERTQRGKRARVQAGKPLHGPRPLYGYKWRDAEKTGLVVDEVSAAVVRRIFADVAAGKSLRRIAFALTAEGIPTPTGRAVWNPAVVGDILHHPTYAGRLAAYRYRVERNNGTRQVFERGEADCLPLPDSTAASLVDDAAFQTAQAALARNKAQAGRRVKHPEDYLLRGGYARCGYCGTNLHAGVFYSRRYYRCGANKHAHGRCSAAPSMSARRLDEAVWGHVEAILTQPEIIATELATLERNDPTEVDLARVDRALAEIARKQANLSRAIAALDSGDAEALVAEMAALGSHKRQLEAERSQLLGRHSGWESAKQRLQDLQDWCRAVAARVAGLDFDARRLALHALSVTVDVWRAGHRPRYIIRASLPVDGHSGGGLQTRTLGKKAAVANQKWLPWTTGVSRLPTSGPAVAWPTTFQALPVCVSTMRSPSLVKVKDLPSMLVSKTPVAPTSREPAIEPLSRAEAVPLLKKTAIGWPPTASYTTPFCSSTEKG